MTALGTSSTHRPTAGDDVLLDHDVPLGATVTVQGPGGSGKSVLLAALARA